MPTSRSETKDLFGARVYVGLHAFAFEEMQQMRELALELHERLNPQGKPWSRLSRQSLHDKDDFSPVCQLLEQVVDAEYGCTVTALTGREVVMHQSQALPLHCEDADLSAVFFLSHHARPDPRRADYAGAFVLVNPSGPFGFKRLPWEGLRSELIYPAEGMLLVFPSYLAHHTHPYNAQEPGIELHFELKVADNHAHPRLRQPSFPRAL